MMFLVLCAVILTTALFTIIILLNRLLHAYDKLIIAIELNLEIILGHTWCGNLDLELLIGLDNVDWWCCTTLNKDVGPLIIEEVTKHTWESI